MDDTLFWIILGAIAAAVLVAVAAPSKCNHKCKQGRHCDCGYNE